MDPTQWRGVRMKTLIRNGNIVTAVDNYVGDLLIEDETISLIGQKLDLQADKVIDAAGSVFDIVEQFVHREWTTGLVQLNEIGPQ